MSTITKEVLLKSDPELKNRPYQLEALLSIFLYAKCLVKMFCGTGKSRIITNVIIHEKKELSVVVFPSLALISQYSADYLNNAEYVRHFKKHKTLNVSSEILSTIESTTAPKEIKKFLKMKSPKIILVTYQSYQVLLDCLEGQKIGLVCYDEAHHVVSPETQKLVFGTDYYEKEVFFTATPKNENGITMFDRDNSEKNMCGPVAYDYTYLQGLVDEVLNAFEICIDMYTDNTNASIYEAMARAILARNTSRVLSFHSGVNGESNTNVWNFVNEAEFHIAFEKVQKAEFPEKDYYKKITFKGMDGNTPSVERKAMLKALDDTPNNEIYIIASCETIGEGVDTKKANMCLFADPKSSVTKIIQNIGRVVRRNKAHPLSTILIPCWVNMENYAEAGGDRVKQDELIRQQMRSEKGDYASILNVLGALRQEDPEIYEQCLNYSDSLEDVSEADSDEEESVSEADTVSESDYESEADTESDSASESEARRQPKRIRMSIHQNDAIQMLWGVKGELDFSQKFCSVVIECEVFDGVERWKQTLEKVKAYIDEHQQRPSKRDLNIVIKKLGNWIGTQVLYYKKNAYIMSKPEIRAEWETTLQKYGDYLCIELEEQWRLKHAQLIDYMEIHKQSPQSTDKKLRNWVGTQKTTYANKSNIMKSRSICSEWETTIQKYGHYLCVDFDKKWRSIHAQLIAYMEEHKKRPSEDDTNYVIKTLGCWVSNQKQNYMKKLHIMSNAEIRAEWENTIQKYGVYLCIDLEKQWRLKHAQLIDYMEMSNESPSTIDENPEVKKLGDWVSSQKTSYAKKIHIMKNNDIRTEWEATLQKYGDLSNPDEKWRLTHTHLIAYMDKYKKRPSESKKNTPEIQILGLWVTNQKKNYNKNAYIMSNLLIRAEWEATLQKYGKYLCDMNERWQLNHAQLIAYMDKYKMHPKERDANPEIKKLGKWLTHQKDNYTKNIQIMSNPDIRTEWEATLQKYGEYLNQSIIPLPTTEAPPPKKRTIKIKKQTAIPIATTTVEQTTPHHFPPPSEIGLLHKTYLKMRSDTLNAKFKAEPKLWRDYHATRKRNFATYDPASIPSNQIIRELEKIQTKRRKVVVDMGCGEAPIAHHFQNDLRFTFHNYDHQSGGDPLIQEVDISALPLDDASVEIGIMSLALWGTLDNCTQYIKEAYRVLESGGLFYISDSTKKWSPEPLTPENGGEFLRTLLAENGFRIIDSTIGSPFCLFVCNKL